MARARSRGPVRFATVAHPDLVYIHSDGSVDTFTSYREKVETGSCVCHHVLHPIDRVVVTGATAYVLGEMHAAITANGVEKSFANVALSVWTHTDVGWCLLAAQTTRPTRPLDGGRP